MEYANKNLFSVKQIFQENWKDYLKNHEIREIEKVEVEKMLSCKDNSRGGFWYYCKNCNEYVFVPFGCNSRLCSCHSNLSSYDPVSRRIQEGKCDLVLVNVGPYCGGAAGEVDNSVDVLKIASSARIPLVVLARGSREVADLARQVGADKVFNRPVKTLTLLSYAKRCLESARAG